MFNKIFDINYKDIDLNGALKLPVLLEYMESVAYNNIAVLGCGYDVLKEKNYGWFLLKYAIEFFNYPKDISSIKVATDPRGSNKIFTYRDFYAYDNDDNLLLKASSLWALMDLTNKTMLQFNIVFPDLIPSYQKRADDIQFGKIPLNIDYDLEKKFETSFYDIDINQHVNNVNYIKWGVETLPLDFLKKIQLKKLDIAYKKEIQYGQKVLSLAKIDGKNSIHTIKNADTNEDLCLIKATYL